MSSQEAIVAVLLVAIFANVVLAVGLVVGPRIRARREASYRDGLREAACVAPGPGSNGAQRPIANGRPYPAGSGAPSGASLDARGAAMALARPGFAEPLTTDPETGFALTASWSKWLAEEGARVGRYGHPSTIVLV